MEILWVNHASFVIASGRIRLLTDPWLYGTAFNDSWDLLVPSAFQNRDFENITHIWFSHEHPDHFSPPVLGQIPEATRRQITVLFQETRDRRVVNYCRKLGFSIQELPDGKPISLDSDFSVTCGKVPFYDSWLACKAEGLLVLDLNDCVLENSSGLTQISKKLGPVDVLFSQFSYASWFGNSDEPQNYCDAAAAMKEQLLQEILVTKPRFTVPCASFVRFCHSENQFMNLYVNRVSDIVDEIKKQSASTPIVLFPGDKWTVGTSHESDRAIKSYQDADAADYSFRRPERVELDEILTLSRKYRQKLLERNSRAAIYLAQWMGVLPSVLFHVEDLNTYLVFDWTSGLRPTARGGSADVTIGSESLAYLFRFDWGLDTLQVNGRFTASKAGFRKLIRTFSIGSLNNMGLQFSIQLIKDTGFMRRAILKVVRAR